MHLILKTIIVYECLGSSLICIKVAHQSTILIALSVRLSVEVSIMGFRSLTDTQTNGQDLSVVHVRFRIDGHDLSVVHVRFRAATAVVMLPQIHRHYSSFRKSPSSHGCFSSQLIATTGACCGVCLDFCFTFILCFLFVPSFTAIEISSSVLESTVALCRCFGATILAVLRTKFHSKAQETA